MPLPNRLPASVRYIKARFRPLMQFRFWLAIIILSLTGLFAWEAWQHPEWLINTEEETSPTASDPSGENGISQEDSAIAADIDSLPVLLEQLNSISISPNNTSNQSPQTLFDEFLKKQAAAQAQRSSTENATTAPSAYDPLEIQVPRALNSNAFENSPTLPSSNPSLPGYGVPSNTTSNSVVGGTNPLNSTPQNSNPAPVNPLQEALQRTSPVNSTTPSTQTPTNSLGQNSTGIQQPNASGSVTGVQPGSTLPGQGTGATSISPYSPGLNYSNMPSQGVGSTGSPSYTDSSVPPNSGNVPLNSYIYSQPQIVPGSAPLQPATPSGVPVTPGSLVQNGISGSGVVNSSNFVNPGLQPSQVQPSQMAPPPFSVPRPVPGRYIGGGRINTFSNP